MILVEVKINVFGFNYIAQFHNGLIYIAISLRFRFSLSLSLETKYQTSLKRAKSLVLVSEMNTKLTQLVLQGQIFLWHSLTKSP